MNAKEMFERIGWNKVENPEMLPPIFDDYYDESFIVYEYYHFGKLTCRLYLTDKKFGFSMSSYTTLEETVEFHLALHEQMKELGWINGQN